MFGRTNVESSRGCADADVLEQDRDGAEVIAFADRVGIEKSGGTEPLEQAAVDVRVVAMWLES